MADTDKKRPWLKFYPSDWRGDPKLRMCSIGARGLWAEMICLMHEADPYGHLLVNNVPVTNRQLASLAGIPQPECMKFMMELESAGVYSRTEKGVIFSRRMVRDSEKSLQGKKDIKKRWGDRSDDRSPNTNPIRSPNTNPITLEARVQIDDDGKTRAGTSLISAEAFKIADALEKACGYDLPEEIPPGWCGGAMWVQKCLNDGWIGAVMIDAAKGVARRAKSPIMGFKYLEKPLAQAMAEHIAPLPQVEVRQPEKLTVIANARQQQPGSVIQAADRLLDKIRSFDAGPGEANDVCDGTGSLAPRLLSQG